MVLSNDPLTKLFGESMALSEGRITGIHTVLHELVELGIGMVEDIDTVGSDLTVDSGGFSMDDVLPHKQSIL